MKNKPFVPVGDLFVVIKEALNEDVEQVVEAIASLAEKTLVKGTQSNHLSLIIGRDP